MRYQSNLACPDLSSHFKLLNPPKQIRGHDAPSDPDFEPDCTFWTHDEIAILCAVAGQMCVKGTWIDIGARFGWTAIHVNWMTNRAVYCIDPGLHDHSRYTRFRENLGSWPSPWIWPHTSDHFFETASILEVGTFGGFVIDGNHDSPFPLRDAVNAERFGARGSVVMFHDFWGGPIRDGVRWLMGMGYDSKFYYTPNGVAVCWRGLPDFVPPEHLRDGNINWSGIENMLALEGWV